MYDVAIVGGGPGGYVAAIRSAQLGLSTCLIEKDAKLGGTCLHRGCIPTKTWLHDSQLLHKMQHSDKFGIVLEGSVRMDMARFLKRKNDVISRMAMGIDGLMKKSRIEVITGRGRLVAPTVVAVGERQIEARHVILATGSRPSSLGQTVDGTRILTSDEMLNLDRIPASLTVLGAGAVGMEFACIYAQLGTQVTVVEMLDRALPLEDEEISAEILKSYHKQGIKILTAVKMEEAVFSEQGVKVRLSNGTELESEILLLAAGRLPVLEDLGLEELGVERAGRFIKVDEFMRTNLPGLYAIGDIVPTPQLAHVASAEGIVAVEHAAGHETRPLNYGKIPSATYCQPEVASVGLTEKAAREAGHTVRVGRFPFAALGKASVIGETEGLVKIVADEAFGELLGVHIIGPHATDLIAEACVALSCEATVEELFRTVHAHPTLSEAVMEAAHGVFSNPIHYIPPPPRKAKPQG